MADIIVFIICGFISGAISGMGMGGGTVLIPALVLLTSLSQTTAQGINMTAFIPGAIIAIILHKKAGRIDFSACIPIVLSGILFALLGAYIATITEGSLLRRMFAVFLFLLAAIQIYSDIKGKTAK